MKKLMITMALGVMAGVANSASIDWKINGTSADVGATVYILQSVAESYESAEEFASAAIAQGDIEKVGSRSYYAKGTITNDSITKSLTELYAAIVSSDAKSYTYLKVDVTSGMVYDLTASPPESASATFTTTLANISASSTSANFVPEPTSGLLMLLGLAGLALKRKRA